MVKQMKPFGIEVFAASEAELFAYKNKLRDLCLEHGLVVIRGNNILSSDRLLEFAANDPAKELLHWDFGPVMEMKPQADAKNYLFSHEAVPFHWDGAFYKEPSFLLFNCVEAPNKDAGGETLFCNTEAMVNDQGLSKEFDWSSIKLTYETKKLAHYGGNITVNMVQKHPHKATDIIRYAEAVHSKLNPVLLVVDGVLDQKKFENAMAKIIYNPKYCLSHRWQAGDIVIADNFSLIHGRNKFAKETSRHFRRVQIL
ncbi:MAG: TauD/TfdA family dioxygenase [Gammaproteobacteria bacterium]|nr:TauD/TfdA family dioxygenase [Gammaproteobacteria bacterium]